jgi:hypothetical protein
MGDGLKRGTGEGEARQSICDVIIRRHQYHEVSILSFQTYLKEDPLFRRFYITGFAGLALIIAVYLARFVFRSPEGVVYLVLDTFPNLFGSFGAPFLILLIMASRRKNLTLLRSLAAFLQAQLITFGGMLLIEGRHAVLNGGYLEWHDIYASLVGAAVAAIVWRISLRGQEAQAPLPER